MKEKTVQKKKTNDRGLSAGQWLLHVVQGIFIGGGAILPGISGGVLCVTFGIYQPLMALFSHPLRTLRSSYKLFIPFVIGGLLGFILFARAVELFFEASSALAVCLFVGLIAGTLPSLFKEAGKKGTANGSLIGFTISLFILFAVLSYLKTGVSFDIKANEWWYFFCGAVWGLSLVVPGLSSSSVLIFMGLYQSMASGIASLDFGVLLPLAAGILITVVLFARIVDHLLERYYSITYHTILGIVIASTLLIVPSGFFSVTDVILSLVFFAAGFAIALAMSRYGDRVREGDRQG
jgi:putative membrane protein